MRERSNHKSLRAFLAGLLALVLTLAPVLSSLPAIQANAAEQIVWFHASSGAGNSNGHSYSNASSNPAAALLYADENTTMKVGDSLSLTFQMVTPTTSRFGIFYTYIDDNNWLYIGSNPNGSWYYQYKIDGNENYPSIDLPANVGEIMNFSASLDREKLTIIVNDVTLNVNNQALSAFAEMEQGRVGFRAGTYQSTALTEFRFSNVKIGTTALSTDDDAWAFLCPEIDGQLIEKEEPEEVYNVTGKIVDSAEGKTPIENATVRIGTDSAKTGAEGTFTLEGIPAGTYDLSISAAGYQAKKQSITIDKTDLALADIELTKKGAVVYENSISSGSLKAAVGKNFPQVMQYEVGTGDQKKIMFAQPADLSIVKINGKAITPVMGEVTFGADNAVYPMTLKDIDAKIDLEMTVKISVADNDLTWEVTDIKKAEGCTKIRTIEVPDLNLATIYQEQTATEFEGANLSSDTNKSGDTKITFEENGGFAAGNEAGYAYGFVSADGLSAGLWSNSEAAGDKRVVRKNDIDSMSLTSAAWYYEYGDIEAAAQYAGTPVSDLPSAKVCIATDLNEDGTVNWQDGAIAYRDIMNNPVGSETMPELVNYRIVMNFSSQATNPFLKTADNIKRVYLATDGLGQAVMMKGYGSEGHDSANSEYGYIGERIGDVKDLKQLNEIAHQYNTQTGIHVNAQEAYPEAQTFSDALINGSSSKGWGWLDQSYTINRNYDLGTGLRYKRMLQLYDRLNDTSLYANAWPGVAGQGTDETVADDETIAKTVEKNIGKGSNLDFIYLDVWYGDAWETRKIAKQFNSLGWRWTTEFGYEGEYDATWQHWATEGSYGGSTGKGMNSDVARFIRNHQKDTYVLNWPSYGGTADNPLLGGFDLGGFEGWGSNNNFDQYITKTFAINLPTKFLQHYQVTKWVNYEDLGETSPVGNHEKEITLTNGTDTVVVTRNETQRNDDYVERTITLNGKEVLRDVSYLLPWKDAETGEEKLYHYNYDGGDSIWKLPDDWAGLTNVYVYQLTDQGRINEVKVPINAAGEVILTAAAKTPYIVVKGEKESEKKVDGYGDGTHLKDPGFNNYAGTEGGTVLDSTVWTGDAADAKVVRVESGTKYLELGKADKDVSVSTTITDLEAGKDYVAQVYVDNKSDAKAILKVTGGEADASNYTLKSLAGNYIRCDAHNVNAVKDSKMQAMLVPFKAKAATATLTLTREKGEGVTYFDDLRIIQKKIDNIQADGSFKQDFESVTGGLYPFVMGPAQGVNDQVTHLSELHAPYTQSGWGNVVLDDVIAGNWSLKHHGSNSGIIYRTIPQNLHLEANVTYDVTFDYQAGSANSYRIVIGDGDNVTETLEYMKKTAAPAVGQNSTTEQFSFQITGGADGQSWFGLASTGTTEHDSYGKEDFVMDNLEVKLANMSISKGSLEMQGVGTVEKLEVSFRDGNTQAVTWESSDPSVAAVDENGFVDATGVGKAVVTATTEDGKSSVKCNVTVVDEKIQVQDGQFAAGKVYTNTEETTGEDAPAANAFDGDTSTIWHSQWNGTNFSVSESNPAIITTELAEDAQKFNGIQLVQRPSGNNGLVQKITYVIGNSFDEETNTVGDVVKEETVTIKNTGAGNIENIDLGGEVTGKYLQIKVLSGSNGFASLAEVNTYLSKKFESLAEETAAVADAQTALEAATAAKTAAQTALETAKAEEADAVTDLDKAAAALKTAKAELEVAKAEAKEAEAEKALADAEKALADAKAEKNKDNEAVKAREEANATAAQQASEAAAAKITEKQNAVTPAEEKVDAAQKALDKVVKEQNDKEVAELLAASQKADETAAAAAAKVAAAQAAKDAADKAAAAAKTEQEKAQAEVKAAEADLALQKAQLDKATADKAAEEAKQALAQKQADIETDAAKKAALQKQADDAKAAAEAAAAQMKNLNETGIPAAQKKVDEKKAALANVKPNPTPDPTPEKPTTAEVKGVIYKILNESKGTAVALKGKSAKAKSVNIQATVKIGDKSYKVVQIANNAFKNYKKMTKLTIGKNITTIGKNSFMNCKKLSKISVKGTAIKKVKAGAFKKTSSKVKVTLPKKIPAKKRNSLKKVLRKGGISAKAVIK